MDTSNQPPPSTTSGTGELLRDAYIALGSAIAALRSMPMRRHADVEEDLAVTAASREIAEAAGALAKHASQTGTPEISIPVEARPFGGSRALVRPVVWEWIATLQAVRVKIATQMEADGLPVPDDLPEGSPLEAMAGHPAWKTGTVVLFAVVVLGLLIALVSALV